MALPDDQQLTLELAAVEVSSTRLAAVHGGHRQQRVGLVCRCALVLVGRAAARPVVHRQHRQAAGTFTGDSGAGGSFATVRLVVHRPSGTSGSGERTAEQPGLAASAPSPAFKGIGAALVLLGLLAAAALALAYRRVDDAARLLGSSSCADGDPLLERFAADADELSDFGGPSV